MKPLYIVANVWIEAGRVADFEAYETKAARIMKRYGGQIERTIRPVEGGDANTPFEIHVLRFPDQLQFDAFRADDELKALAPERAAVITRSVAVLGIEAPVYGMD